MERRNPCQLFKVCTRVCVCVTLLTTKRYLMIMKVDDNSVCITLRMEFSRNVYTRSFYSVGIFKRGSFQLHYHPVLLGEKNSMLDPDRAML